MWMQLDPDLARRVDPLSATLNVDLDGWRGAARQRHWATLDDVVDFIRLDDEYGSLGVTCRLRTSRGHCRQHGDPEQQTYRRQNNRQLCRLELYTSIV